MHAFTIPSILPEVELSLVGKGELSGGSVVQIIHVITVRRLQELCMPLPYLQYDRRWSYPWLVKENSQVDLLYK